MAGATDGTGSFRCEQCGYVVATTSPQHLQACPSCGTDSFVQATAVPRGRFSRPRTVPATEADDLVAEALGVVEAPGTYLAFRDAGELRVVPVQGEWTRIGRSLAADVRFDDPTVSRRHALLVRAPDGLRVLDDRSLNGVFVNGERVEWRMLHHGDELLVGRHRLVVVERATDREATPA
ncbi:MAG TPA: FHA domain-containing protein [Baekduia sp.]|nr:FHA domain-containing protein [Baekduia sp.]